MQDVTSDFKLQQTQHRLSIFTAAVQNLRVSRETSTNIPINGLSAASNARHLQEIDESSRLTKMSEGGTIHSQNRNGKKNTVQRFQTRNNSVKTRRRRDHIEQLVLNPFEMQRHRNTQRIPAAATAKNQQTSMRFMQLPSQPQNHHANSFPETSD